MTNYSRRKFCKAGLSLCWATARQPSFTDNSKRTQTKRSWELEITRYSDVLLPREHGQLTTTGQYIKRRYPSRDHCMQMAAFFSKDGGVLVIANDPLAGVADWSIINGAKLRIDFYEAVPNVMVLPIAPTIEAAANAYKTWANQQFWIKNRSRSAPQLTFMTMASGSSIQVDNDHLTNIFKLGELPVGAWFTHWRKAPFDVLYPDYTAKEPVAFRRLLLQLKQRGGIAFPYVNGLTWDINNSAFRKAAQSLALRDQNGNTRYYKETMKHLRYACPHTKRWQQEILNVRENLLDLAGNQTEGVYLDMLAASQPITCWATNHGHVPGDPNAWVAGIRNLFKTTRGHIFTEGCAEVYLDLVDYVLMHFHTDKPDSVPLWTLVYGDHVASLGWRLPADIDLKQFSDIRKEMLHYRVKAHGSPWMADGHECNLFERQLHHSVLGHKN